MNWGRIILDGLAMSAVFNLAVGLFWLVRPSAFTGMYPKQIQKIAPPMDAKDRKHITAMSLTVYPSVILYGVISAYCAGIENFWPLFWTAYIEMFIVNLGDFFGLDLFFREKMGSRLELPGTEGNELYRRRIWMRTLGIPEHFVLWPFIGCPAYALLSAGLGLLLRWLL